MKTAAAIIVSGVVVVLALALILLEKKNMDLKKMQLLCVMTAASVAGRFVFAFLPGFKPVTAMVVLTGMYLGADAGFLCGSLTALISNFYFGQGSYTPFQMLVWGILGFLAGILSSPLMKRKILLILYGALAGVVFSLLMDVYTVIWVMGYFDPSYYLVCITAALPFMVIYALSNVIFLLALSPLLGKKLEHIRNKFMVANKCA